MVKNTTGEASFVIALIQMKDSKLQEAGIKLILDSVHYLWAEYYEKLKILEKLYYSESNIKPLIAYALAQILFYANKFNEALDWIVHAENFFGVNKRSFFNDSILPLIISKYISLVKKSNYIENDFDKLSLIVDQVFDNSLEFKDIVDLKNLVGLAIDTKKYNFLKIIIAKASTEEINSVFDAIYKSCDAMLEESRRNVLLSFNEEFNKRNYDSVLQKSCCLYKLSLADQHAELISKLWIENQKELSLQIAADVWEFGDVVYAEATYALVKEFVNASDFSILEKVIKGEFSSKLSLNFLKHSAVPDLDLIKTIANNWKVKDSISNNAVAFSLTTLLKGTENIELLKKYNMQFEKMKNWACFSICSSLGNIFSRNSYKEELKELKIPENSSPSQGGELVAQGFSNYCLGTDEETKKNLLKSTKSKDGFISHGAFLSLGLQFAFSNDTEIIESCKIGLYSDEALTGEAASLALGMVKANHWDEELAHSLINFCRDNDHTKITRSLTIFFGLSAMNCIDPKKVLDFFDRYIIENDYIIRTSVINALSLAYLGTENTQIVSKLLTIIANDVSSDVRRSAVIGLSMVMLKNRSKAVSLLRMLSTSYNGYVRHAVALSLGFFSVHSFDKKVTKILRRLFEDKIDYVRQAAAISLGLTYQLGNEQFEPSFEQIKKLLVERLERKQENPISKLGCFMGLAFTNPGGGNCMLTLRNISGIIKPKNILALFIFTYYWYWFPCLNFISLALEPTFIVGVDSKLNVPSDFIINCKAPKKYFDYIRPVEVLEDKKKETVPAQLSSTRRAKHRLEKKDIEKDVRPSTTTEMFIEEVKDDNKIEKNESKEEKKTFQLSNPARILKKQLNFIEIPNNDQQRYVLIVEGLRSKIIFIQDKRSDEPQNLTYKD